MLSVRLSSRRFCETLARRVARLLDRYSCVRQLALPGCQLDPPTLVRLGLALQHNSALYALDLGRSRLADDAAMLLAHALRRNASLRVLGLAGNALTGRGCRLVVGAIGRARSVAELDLADNRVVDAGCAALGGLLAARDCPLRRLVVANNEFGVAGAAAIFAALRRNSRLVHLDGRP